MNLLMTMVWLWTNTANEVQWSTAQSDAPASAVLVSPANLPTLAPQPDIQSADRAIDAAWPVLAEHPTPSQIPADGMSYRLAGSNITWWVVRQRDAIATQVSAHDDEGNPISRTINLRTGEDETINLRVLSSAQNFGQLRAARVVKTNDAIRGRNQR